jgi:cob(I)alamin adenosyltransferase
MKIYTKKGDDGTTQLIGGSRVKKNSVRIDSYGTVDELNSWIGLIGSRANDPSTENFLREIQDRLFVIGSHLAEEKRSRMKLPQLDEKDVKILEDAIDEMEGVLPELKSFILPGGDELNSFAHIARCVCRRAERAIATLHEKEPVEDIILKYVNRLSDYLFMLARKFSHDHNKEEVLWKPRG